MADAFFSVDVETDGPIPGPFSMLSFAFVFVGTFDGRKFEREPTFTKTFYRELKPISKNFDQESLQISGLDRDSLCEQGEEPKDAMIAANEWILQTAGADCPVLVAYPVSFDWTWLYWYFVSYLDGDSPFKHSRCFDVKTAVALTTHRSVCKSGRHNLPVHLKSDFGHTHNALDDAIEQADIVGKVLENWTNSNCDYDKVIYDECRQRNRATSKI